MRKVFKLFVLPLLFAVVLLCNYAEAATGRVVTVDGIGGLLTAVDPLYVPSNSTSYLYNAIDQNWRSSLTDQIGPVQSFYWGGNLYTQTTAAVASLYSILKPISDNNKITNAPLVIISHSWGSVLTYIVLHEHPDIVIDKLITMGSPLDSSMPVVNTITYPWLVSYGIFTVHALPNIKIWHNYWASCDPVSSSISAAMNHQSGLSVLVNGFCHNGYFEDSVEWGDILADALNTQPPLAVSYTPFNPSAPANISFTVFGSMLSGMNIVSFSWDFGDGQTAAGQSVNHIYKNPQTYNVSVTLTDNMGITQVLSEAVTVRPLTLTFPIPMVLTT